MTKIATSVTKLARLLRSAARDAAGVSMIEFAMVAPVFGLTLAGAVDLGGALYTQFGLNASVSAGANYAMINGANASSANGASLATNVAAIVADSQGANWATSGVVVNNGPTSSRTGTPTNADSCYCPTGASATTIAWGAATTCGTTCSNGGFAGKFVTITATRSYSPFFSAYHFLNQNQAINASAVVQVQ